MSAVALVIRNVAATPVIARLPKQASTCLAWRHEKNWITEEWRPIVNYFSINRDCVKRKKKDTKGKKVGCYIDKETLGNHQTVGIHIQYTIRILRLEVDGNIAQYIASRVYILSFPKWLPWLAGSAFSYLICFFLLKTSSEDPSGALKAIEETICMLNSCWISPIFHSSKFP